MPYLSPYHQPLPNSETFRETVDIPQKRANSAAWLKIPCSWKTVDPSYTTVQCADYCTVVLLPVITLKAIKHNIIGQYSYNKYVRTGPAHKLYKAVPVFVAKHCLWFIARREGSLMDHQMKMSGAPLRRRAVHEMPTFHHFYYFTAAVSTFEFSWPVFPELHQFRPNPRGELLGSGRVPYLSSKQLGVY